MELIENICSNLSNGQRTVWDSSKGFCTWLWPVKQSQGPFPAIISKNILCSLAPSFPPLIVCSAFLIQPLLCPVSFLPSQPSHPYMMPGSCSC